MKSIRFERNEKVGSIVLANPPYNRLDLRFAQCLRDAVHEASESDIRVLVDFNLNLWRFSRNGTIKTYKTRF